MKDQVLNYFKTDRGFASGLALYSTLPGANRALAASLTRTGNSSKNVEQLHYDLAKLAGITELELKRIKLQPVGAAAPEPEAAPAPSAGLVDVAALNFNQLKAKVKELGLPVANQKKETLTEALVAHNLQVAAAAPAPEPTPQDQGEGLTEEEKKS